MRDHSECDAAYHEALRRGRDGFAEYLLTRCDRAHGHLTPAPATPTADVAVPTELHPDPTATEETSR